jgi:para-nitrobenzyl esterase
MSGETDSQGRFSFEPGEKVTFSIGGIILGTAAAQNIITPLDLVNGAQDEKNPSVTNITRLLITLDEDSNPENGITIRPELGVSLAGISVDFGMDPDEFAVDDDVLNVISIVNDLYTEADEGERTLCTVQDAQDHLSKTLDELAESDYEHYTHGGGGGGGGGSGGCG